MLPGQMGGSARLQGASFAHYVLVGSSFELCFGEQRELLGRRGHDRLRRVQHRGIASCGCLELVVEYAHGTAESRPSHQAIEQANTPD